jgi:hypothetical protein
MMKRKITLSFARLLKSVMEGEVNAASFSSNKKLLELFLEDAVLDFRLIGNQQKKILCPDTHNLAKYLQNKFGIQALDEYIDYLEKDDVQRSDAARVVGDTKFRKTSVFAGFLVNCYEELNCILHSEPFAVKPATGAFTFISGYKYFQIPDDVTVVVVEGHENFREIARQQYLFESMKPLFVWRYQNSNAIADWLKLIPNQYIHFGDYDPKGIHIYLSEFKSKLGDARGRFFVPPNIEATLVEHGEKDLYEKQKNFIPIIENATDPEVVSLIKMIVMYKKALEQEIFIK